MSERENNNPFTACYAVIYLLLCLIAMPAQAANTVNIMPALLLLLDDGKIVLPPPPPPPPPTQLLGLPIISDAHWNSQTVRHVLNVFAFGGHASDSQINTWANMSPRLAIKQMLTFAEHNLK